MTDAEVASAFYYWPLWARAAQLPPSTHWRIWLILAGRGWGKTRTGAEWIREIAESNPDARIALVGETLHDVRSVMVEGESGLLAIAPPWHYPTFIPSNRLLKWPNGAQAQLFSAEDPEQLRGPQFTHAWCDELAKWRYPASWDNLLMALRLGEIPQVCVTTTPRPVPLLKALLEDQSVAITRGKTIENSSNLSKSFMKDMQHRYANTRLGRQELEGEMLSDVPNALWQRKLFRYSESRLPEFQRIVVAIDPAVGKGETGISVCGIDSEGLFYVLEDATQTGSPEQWAQRAAILCKQYGADRLIAEKNNGGDLVKATLKAANVPIPVTLVTASKGKTSRAEPVATLYEQGRVLHKQHFSALEDQLCSYTGASGQSSPDRMDALVWALTALMEQQNNNKWRIRSL